MIAGRLENEAQVYPANIATLTGLRFIVAACVFFYHIHVFFRLPSGAMGLIASKGYLGVDFFFILSGFILTHVYSRKIQEGKYSRRTFLVHRLARIYPVHLLTLLVAAVLGLTHASGWASATDWPHFFAHLFLVSGWGHSAELSFNQPAWSISAEWFAYLCFPFLLPCLMKLDRVRAFLFALVFFAAVVLVSHYIFYAEITAFTSSYNILRIMPEFCLGMSLYGLSVKYPWKAPGWTSVLLFVLILTSIFSGAPDFVCILLEVAIIYAVAGGALQGRGKFLSSPVMTYLGECSYGFYMVHVLVIYAAWRLSHIYGGLWLWATLAFLFSIAISALLHQVYEQPARRYLHRYG